MEEIKVSVIIPIYKVEKYLRQCVDSVLDQTYRNLEVILVDDGSPDGCPALCDDYAAKDERVTVIHKENGGQSSAREAGVHRATGTKILFLDGDDWLETETVEKCLKALESAKGAECVLFSYQKEYPDFSVPMHILSQSMELYGEVFRDKVYRRLFGLSDEELSHPERMENMTSCCMKFYDINAVRKGKFFDINQIGSCEDGLFNMYALEDCSGAVYLDEPLYHYRKTGASATSTFRPRFIEQWGTLFSIMEAIIDEKGLDECFRRALDNRIALSITAICLNELGNPQNGAKGHIRVIREYLHQPRYRAAVEKLHIRSMPLAWKGLMIASKLKMAGALYLAFSLAKKMRRH